MMYQGFQSAFRGGDRPPITYGFLNEIMDNLCSDGALESDKIGCTQFNEGCTKRSKVRYKVGINPQSIPYGFQNEIMDHPCSDGGPGNNRIICTKFNEGCTKGSKVRSEVWILITLL